MAGTKGALGCDPPQTHACPGEGKGLFQEPACLGHRGRGVIRPLRGSMGGNLCSDPEDLAAVMSWNSLSYTPSVQGAKVTVTDLLTPGEAGSHWALGTGRGLCLGGCGTCTLPRLSSAEGTAAGSEPGLGDPAFQTESTSLKPGPCKAEKILGTFLPPPFCPVLSPRRFLSLPIPSPALEISEVCPHFGHY